MNPRIDDRLLEMTRIMQAQGANEKTIAWARERRLKQFETELSQSRGEKLSLDEVKEASAKGLGYLSELPGNKVDVSLFREKMPQANDPLQGDLNLMMGLLIDDMERLRKHHRRQMQELTKRLDALEKRSRPE